MAQLISGVQRERSEVLVASNDAPANIKAMADYVCDGVNDEVEWQAADDQAYAQRTGTTGVSGFTVYGGRYFLANTFSWRSSYIQGLASPNSGVRVFWNGSDGATALTRPDNDTGGKSFCYLTNLNFRHGTNHPGLWLDLSEGTIDTVDTYCRLNECMFYGGYTQIKIDKFVNIHWEHVRFDNWLDWGVHFIPIAGANLNTFRWSGGSFDSRGDAGTEGFMFIDNAANVGNIGTFHFQDMRWEVNNNWVGRQGAIIIAHPTVSANSRVAGFHFDNITYQDVDNGDGLMANDVLLYVDGGGSPVNQNIILENFRQTGLSKIVGGDYPTNASEIPLQSNYGYVTINQVSNGYSFVTDTIGLRPRTSATITDVIQLRKPTETFDRLTMDGNGKLSWGAGSTAIDAALSRRGADLLGTDDGDSFQAGNGVWNGGRLRLGNYHLWVDATGDLRIKSGAPTSDTDGAVVGTQT